MPNLGLVRYRFSAFWLRSKCSICSYQLNIWYEGHVPSSILNWFLPGDGTQELAPVLSRVGLVLQYRKARLTSPIITSKLWNYRHQAQSLPQFDALVILQTNQPCFMALGWFMLKIRIKSQVLPYSFANGHIMLNTPVLVRSLKLSSIELSQYLDGWPPGNTGCCWHSLFLWISYSFANTLLPRFWNQASDICS